MKFFTWVNGGSFVVFRLDDVQCASGQSVNAARQTYDLGGPSLHSNDAMSYLSKRRWLQFSLRSSLLAIALAAPLFAWLGYYHRKSKTPDEFLLKNLVHRAPHDPRCARLLDNLGVTTEDGKSTPFRGKTLEFHSEYRLQDGSRRVVFVYDPILKMFPGSQPETIVITDSRFRLITWNEVGVSHTMFHAANFVYGENGNPTLELTRLHRFRMLGRGVYRISLTRDGIKPLAGVEWNKEDERARRRFIDEMRRSPAEVGVE